MALLREIDACCEPVCFARREYTPDEHAPRLGQHTERLLVEMRYTKEEVEALKAGGVV